METGSKLSFSLDVKLPYLKEEGTDGFTMNLFISQKKGLAILLKKAIPCWVKSIDFTSKINIRKIFDGYKNLSIDNVILDNSMARIMRIESNTVVETDVPDNKFSSVKINDKQKISYQNSRPNKLIDKEFDNSFKHILTCLVEQNLLNIGSDEIFIFVGIEYVHFILGDTDEITFYNAYKVENIEELLYYVEAINSTVCDLKIKKINLSGLIYRMANVKSTIKDFGYELDLIGKIFKGFEKYKTLFSLVY